MSTRVTLLRPAYWAEFCAHSDSEAYRQRVQQLEAEGLTTSDAQGCADAEWLTYWHKKNETNSTYEQR